MAETFLAVPTEHDDPRQLPFFKDNLAAFREYAPLAYARLAQVQTTHSRLVLDGDGGVDIALGGQRFYGMDAVAFTQRQIDLFFAAPERLFIESLTFGDSAGLEGKYVRALAAALEAGSVALADQRADKAAHFTIVFGLGLGLHLEPLREFTGCAELIIVEPNFDNLYHSLFVIDWKALFGEAAQAGCTVHLVLEKDQGSIASHLRRLIRLGNPALADGAYIYQHYGSSLMTEAHQSFNRDFDLHVLGLGYFEDELLMMANAISNLKRDNVRVVTSQQLPRSEPVFICGSGPSIDSDLEVIAAQRDRAVVVSIGSSLRTLLAYGIRPDFHLETENHPANAAVVKRVAEEFGLTGITLLGATTVQPSMTELFDDVILYFREGQCPATVFGNGIERMGGAGPTVANAAVVTLPLMGFRDIYLFGIDMGSRQADKYHSINTYIGRGETEEWAADRRLPVPANFGGEAAVETLLSWSRRGIEDVLAVYRNVRCVNCSDGARIAGTIPMLPQVLNLHNPPLDHNDVVDDIRSKMPLYPLALTARFWRESDLAQNSQEIFADIHSLLETAAERDDPGLAWVYQLYDLLDEAKAKSPTVNLFLFGTTCLYLGIFWWMDGRIEEPQFRAGFRRTAVAELRSLYADMERRLSILIDDVENCIAGKIDTVDSRLNI